MKANRKSRVWKWAGVTVLLVTALVVALWVYFFRDYTPAEVALDLRAAMAARNAPNPVEQFLELRYGPLTEPANRQKAFLDFFNVGHIEGLRVLVNRMPAERRQTGISNMAQWVAGYRQTMSPAEKESMRSYLNTEAGHATIETATAKYLGQDVAYRAATAPVIAELMATLTEIQKP